VPIIMLVLLVLLCAGGAHAQPVAGTTAVRLNASAGQIYLDEGFPDHWEAGASIRLFVSPRVAVQGELSSFKSTVAGLPNEFTYTIYATALRLFGSVDRRGRPYVVGGLNIRGGGIGNTARWPYGGAGFRFPLRKRISSDLEIGGPLFRVAGTVGVDLR
jgi:hypothetical protein